MTLIELFTCDKCDDVAIIWRDNKGIINFTKCLCKIVNERVGF